MNSINKIKKRKSPLESAKEYTEGQIKIGNDKELWVVKKTVNNIHRWTPYKSCELFGFRPLTVNYLAKNIGTPITIYERQAIDKWPNKLRDFDVKYKFISSGDAILLGSKSRNIKDLKINDWLKLRIPLIKKHDIFIIDGNMKSNNIISTIQAGPLPNELVSTNLMNTEAYIKI
jgi:hypothetical protein